MHLLDRIDHALTTKTVDADAFERFASDVLGSIFPGLAPIPKGTDWGRDADVPGDGDTPSGRVMVTRAQTLKGVRANMVRGTKSLAQHGQPADRVVLANLAVLSARDRSSLEQTANKHGITIAGVYDRVYFANQLRREGEWRTRLLGIPGDPISVSRLPVELAESPLARLPLVGRESELVALRSTTGDVVLVGPPGSGKTRLLAELDRAVFVARDAETKRDEPARQPRWGSMTGAVIDSGTRHTSVRGCQTAPWAPEDTVSTMITNARAGTLCDGGPRRP